MTLRHRGFVNPVPWGIVQQGPLVRVTLGPHPDELASILAAGALPKTFQHHLMVDTGAQITCVENKIAVALDLVPVRFARMMGVSGQIEEYPVYRIGIQIGMSEVGTGAVLPAVFSSDIVGTPSPPTPQTHVGLLGRDFLQFLQLVYDGPKGSFELIDYRHVSQPPPAAPTPSLAAGWRDIQSARKKSKKHKKSRR